ncbi:MAG: hypothetical protein MSS97_07075 [Arcanobacterium sp.]|nr:hypothetical protein [Arcanobacterium sp.]
MRHMERIDNRTRKYLQAKDYMDWFSPAWQALTDEERTILETCFLSGYESLLMRFLSCKTGCM